MGKKLLIINYSFKLKIINKNKFFIILVIDVPDEILIERCCGRRSDPITGKIYHLKFNPPPEDPEI
jgi:hypothetical protein